MDERDNYADYDEAFFRGCLEEHFDVVAQERLSCGTRVLFFAVPKAPAAGA